MAALEIQGSDVEFLVREYNTGDFKRLTCEETLTLDVTNDVNTTKTKCGVFKGIQEADFKVNGTAVFNLSPTSASEISYDEALAFQVDKTKIEWIIRNVSITGYAAGAGIRMSGEGYFVSTQFNAPNGDVGKFSWNIEGVGTLNDTES